MTIVNNNLSNTKMTKLLTYAIIRIGKQKEDIDGSSGINIGIGYKCGTLKN
jgi:hypothetical protein